MRPALSRSSLVALLAVLLLPLAGCGALFGSRYDNFRAYYNAYYNASRVMEDGERQLDRPNQPIDRTRLISLYPTGAGGGNFQEAIDKSSELLRSRGSSKWADDALFLIGKAYYYQDNLVGAEQKFRETIELAGVRNNPRMADEARVWLGRTLGAAQRYEEGAAILQERLVAAEGNRGALARIRLVLGELYAREGRYEEAAAALREGIAGEQDNDFAARALFLLGQVDEAAGQYDAAAQDYRDVVLRRPRYELAYTARLSEALVLGIDSRGRSEEALAIIRRMRRDDKNYENRAEVELAYGRILAASGRFDEALTAMRSVLYDEQMRNVNLRGQAHARLGEFYRDVRRDFVLAAAHFDSASTSIRTVPGPNEAPTRAAFLDIRRTATSFKAFAEVAGRLAETDSLIELGSLDDEAFAARIEQIEAQRLAEFREDQRRLAQTRQQQDFSGGVSVGEAGGGIPGRPDTAPAPGAAVTTTGSRETGFLSYRDPASVQANALTFQRIWGDRPLVPNWRRRSAIDGSAISSEVGGGAAGTRPGAPGFPGTGPVRLDLSPIPRTPEALIALRAERAALRYEAANGLFLSLARPDSAATLYSLALEDDPSPEVARQIRFALAEVEASRGQQARADDLYQTIIDDAPDTPLASAARLRLGQAPIEVEVAAPTSRAYEQARQRWREGTYATAVTDFLALAADTTRSDESPRALLAAATAYMEWAQVDSFDVTAPLPRSVVPEGLFIEPDPTDPDVPVPGTPAPGVTPAAPGGMPGAPVPPPNGGVVPGKPVREQAPVDGKPQRSAPTPPVRQQPLDTTVPDPVLVEDEELLDGESEEDLELRFDPVADVPVEDRVEDEFGDELPINEASGDTDDLADDLADDVIEERLEDSDPRDESPDMTEDEMTAGPEPVVPEPVVPAIPQGPTVDTILRLVISRAPASPYATRATAIREALSAEANPEIASGAVSGSPGATPEAEDPRYGIRGDTRIDSEVGGFTWRAQRITDPLAVLVILEGYERQGIRAAAARDGSAYRILIGQFASRPDAFAVRGSLPEEVQGASASIVPLDSLEVLTSDDFAEGE